MDIVHKEDIDATILMAKIKNLTVLKVVNQVIHKFFSRDVQNLKVLAVIESKMTDGIHKMGLAQPGSAVDVKRIIGKSRLLGDGDGCGMGKLITRTNDKVFESIIRV